MPSRNTTIKFFTDPHGPNIFKTVLRRQAYRFELRPSSQQLCNLRQFAGSCRFVYNKALALNTARYNKKEKRLGYAGLCALLPNWKKEHPFLSEVPAQALQQALKNLERDYGEVGMPRMRAVSQCGFDQCGKYPRGGTRLASLSATFACSKCVVAGTHRRYPWLRRGTRRNPRTLGRGGGQVTESMPGGPAL